MGTDDDRPVDHGAVTAIMASIGAQIRDARRARGWFLSDVAARLGLSASVVCRMELVRREPGLHQVISACCAPGTRFSDVLRHAEDEAFPLGEGPWDLPIRSGRC